MSYLNAHSVSFDGVDLTTITGLTVLAIDPNPTLRRNLSIYDIARANKSKTTASYHTEKNIQIRVNIVASTRALLESYIDSLMGILHDTESTLSISQSGSTREYTATYSDSTLSYQGGSYSEIELNFICSDKFGYETNYTTLLDGVNYSSAQKTNSLVFSGSAPTQVPIISLYYSILNSGDGAYVKIGNSVNGQYITITRNWTSTDELEIDCQNKSVKVNDVEVDFVGAFPEWKTGNGQIFYQDSFLSRQYNTTILYKKRYV